MHFCSSFVDTKLTIAFLFIIRWYINLLNHCISVHHSLIQNYEQDALRKELIIAPLIERLQTAALRKFYCQILLALGATCFGTFFPSTLENELLSKNDLKQSISKIWECRWRITFEHALGGLHIISSSRAINLWIKAQFKNKIFQRRIDLYIPDFIELH